MNKNITRLGIGSYAETLLEILTESLEEINRVDIDNITTRDTAASENPTICHTSHPGSGGGEKCSRV